MFSETREEKILDILKAISYMEREKAIIAGKDKDSLFTRGYTEVVPDDYLSKIMTKAVKDYKYRLHEELKTIQAGGNK